MQAPLALFRIAFTGLAACLIVAGSAPRAGALGITPDPLVFNLDLHGDGTLFLKGNIDFVGMVTGIPSGGIVLDGSVGATDVTLVFTTSIDADSQEMTSTSIFRTPAAASSPVFTGVGTIPGTGIDADGATSGSSSATVLHQLQPGETTDAYFVSFSSISVGDQLGFEFVVLPLGTATVVPEPQAAVLLLLGLAGLGWRARGRLRV